MALLIPLVLWLLPEWPADVGASTVRRGCRPSAVAEQTRNPLKTAFGGLGEGLESRDFWLLAGTFFVCGFTTNGLVGTHMIALCGDHGLDAVAAGGLLAMMGLFDLVGTTASGWLTDRYRPAQAAFRLLRPARPVADLSALRRFHLSRPVAVRGVLWPGLDRHRAAHPGARQPGLRQPEGARHVRLDLWPAIRWARPRPPSSPAARAPPPGPIWKPLSAAGFVAVVAAFAALMIGRRPRRDGGNGSLSPAKTAAARSERCSVTLFKPLNIIGYISAPARHESGKAQPENRQKPIHAPRTFYHPSRRSSSWAPPWRPRRCPFLPSPGSRTWSRSRASATTCWSAMAWWSA